MAYKYKPNKSVAKRFKVTKTGKVKRHHSFTSHLMSSRPANKRRKLRRSAIVVEGHAKRMRVLMGVSHLHPATVEHNARQNSATGAEGAAAQGGAEGAASEAAKKKSPTRRSKPGPKGPTKRPKIGQ